MSLNTRDGYTLEGNDVVPERPRVNKVNKLSQLTKLLRQANRREEQANERADYWHRAYQRLNQEYIALQFEDPGETYILCTTCSRDRDTVKTLTRHLEENERGSITGKSVTKPY